MKTEKREKDRGKRRSDNDREDDRRKRRRQDERKHRHKEEAHHKRDRKKDKKKKHSKHRHKEDGNRRHADDRKKRSGKRKDLIDLGPKRGTIPDTKLTSTDYFEYHQHLWAYLYREEGVLFNDLPSSVEAHAAFERFVDRYNKGELEQAYYEQQLPSTVVDECKTTNHTWSFKLSKQEGDNLAVLQEGVRKQTDYQT